MAEMRTFLPKGHYMPWCGQYRPVFRLYKESPWELVPKSQPCATAGQAIAAADAYLEMKLNPPIRREIAVKDVLGIAQWHEQRAARQAEQQEQALGGILVKSRKVTIERKRLART
jgi:hypothetical protein